MSPQEEQEFELVLGNKQLLSLFFVVVVLFAVFFSFGYTVGFSRGQDDRVARIAKTDPVEKESDGVRIPDALLENVPKEPITVPAPAKVRDEPLVVRNVRAEPAAPSPPPRRNPKPEARGGVTGAAIARAIHIQVAAMRVRADAEMLVGKLQAKRYPVALYDQADDGWWRVVIGPFPSVASAKAEQKKLAADGFKTILRRR